MDHTKARAVAKLGNDPFVGRLKREEQAEVCAAYLDALRQLQERDAENERLRGALPEGFTLGESEYGFDLYQDDEWCAGGTGPLEAVLAEANHYALMYGQDGPTRVEFYKRTALRADEPVGEK